MHVPQLLNVYGIPVACDQRVPVSMKLSGPYKGSLRLNHFCSICGIECCFCEISTIITCQHRSSP